MSAERSGQTVGDHVASPSKLVISLADELAASGVTYCHWKSNEAISRSISGENDLDLLVSRTHADRFLSVLHGLGFRPARPTSDRQVPGILDYYAMDDESGRLIHVHAHFVLALGDDMTKNFRLPIEDAYLRSSTAEGILPIPSPEFEYLIFLLRMVVKHATWDAQLGRKGRLTPSERRELAYLEERIEPAAVESLRATHLPFLEPELLAACRSAIGLESGRLARSVTANRLLGRLDAHGRRPRRVDTGLRIWRRRWRRIAARITPLASGKKLERGGLVIGVVGGDGSGKSSAVQAIDDLLSKDFAVRRFHLGKPRRSFLTRAVKRPMGKVRERGRLQATTLPAWTEFDRFPGYGFMIWHLLTARDRHREYRNVRRVAGSGRIALCDRFPTGSVSLMDSPRTSGLPGISRRPLARWLVARESAYYREILAPDLLIVLRVSPEVAVACRHDQEPDFVARRAAEVFEQQWEGRNMVVIDADRSHDEVLAEVKAAVWAAM